MADLRGPNNESYDKYYSKWVGEQQKLCEEISAKLEKGNSEDELEELLTKVKNHYEEYYGAKEGAAKQDVLKVLQPKWRSPLEVAFMWIGGWRPAMIFQLAYAQAGHHTETDLSDFLDGLDTPDLTSLSAKQLVEISRLQQKKLREEDALSRREAVIQQSLADHPLSAVAALGSETGSSSGPGDRHNSISDTMDEKVKELEDLMCDADSLRFETLTEFLDILSTVQAAQYLVAAGKLHVAIRDIGQKREESTKQ